MARLRSCDQHPELSTTRTRWTRPAAPHDPANKMHFSPSGAFLGFAAALAPATSLETETPEKEINP
jgi:hypothetical protein